MYNGWCDGVDGVLLDATGVLYNSGQSGGSVISGSVKAIEKLKEYEIPFKVCSNQSTQSRKNFAKKLQKYGYNLDESDIICPGPIIVSLLKEQGLRPHLLVHPGAVSEYESLEKENPNCVVLGDCQEHFNYHTLNEAFNVLDKEKRLYTFGVGRYYRRGGDLVLDSGAYAKMLQHATNCEITVCGKPEPSFFKRAVDSLNLKPSQCVMIGDDIVGDIAGAQTLGMRGILVRTGKYSADIVNYTAAGQSLGMKGILVRTGQDRPNDEQHLSITPDVIVNDLLHAVSELTTSRDRYDSGIDMYPGDVIGA